MAAIGQPDWLQHKYRYFEQCFGKSSLDLNYNFFLSSNSAYNQPADKKLLVIRNWVAFLKLYQGSSLLYINKELWL